MLVLKSTSTRGNAQGVEEAGLLTAGRRRGSRGSERMWSRSRRSRRSRRRRGGGEEEERSRRFKGGVEEEGEA